MKYRFPFTSEILINSQHEAYQAIMHFCDYCQKDAIGQHHCSGRDSALCDVVQKQIADDWSKDPE